MDITWKEVFPIVLAVYTWGSLWSRHKILFHCDNQTVVDIWERCSTCATHTMALVHLLHYRAEVLYNTTLTFVLFMSLIFAMTLQTPSLVSDTKIQKPGTQFQLTA